MVVLRVGAKNRISINTFFRNFLDSVLYGHRWGTLARSVAEAMRSAGVGDAKARQVIQVIVWPTTVHTV